MQAAGAWLDAEAIVDQRLHAVAPAVDEQVGGVRPGGAEHLHDRQGFVRSGVHIQRLRGQPDLGSLQQLGQQGQTLVGLLGQPLHDDRSAGPGRFSVDVAMPTRWPGPFPAPLMSKRPVGPTA